MMGMGQLLKMVNPVQNYAWGTRDTLARLRGENKPASEPEAELWVGAHAKAPSSVLTAGGTKSLADWVDEDPETVLPEGTSGFPFLFKILAIDSPLSLQVHPSEQQAVEGFEKENRAGIALGANERNYKDDRSKPETVIAYSPVRLLTGIRPAAELKRIAKELNLTWLAELADYDAAEIIKAIFAKDETSSALALDATVNAAMDWSLAHPFDEDDAAYRRDREGFDLDAVADLILLLHDAYPGDRGTLVAVAMNQLFLKPGESAHTPHGQVHAYLQGTAIEIMNPSDNVMRAGLTPKHIDIKELLSVVVADQPAPDLVLPAEQQPGVARYGLWDSHMHVDHVAVSPDTPVEYTCDGLSAILCVEGDVEVAGAGERIGLRGTESALHIGSRDVLTLSGNGQVYTAVRT